jgi:hypothetical protein
VLHVLVVAKMPNVLNVRIVMKNVARIVASSAYYAICKCAAGAMTQKKLADYVMIAITTMLMNMMRHEHT